jgi:micrococcal nuclease
MVVSLKQFFQLALWVSATTGACFAASRSAIVGTPAQFEASAHQAGELRKVVRVVDGDTIVVSPNEKVRLIGVDTPETVHPKMAVACFGKQAKQFTRDAVEGKTIRLVLDKVNTKRRHRDRYGRTLAYAYLADGTMLNAELIRQGYAHAYTRFPFRYLVEFRQLERAARTEAVGLWSSCPLK